MPQIADLETMLARGLDSALLRYGLGSEYLKRGEHDHAIAHLRQAVALDSAYSAAWKLLGKALTEANRPDEATQAYEDGIRAAERKGDKQAAKEMGVFLQRLRR